MEGEEISILSNRRIYGTVELEGLAVKAPGTAALRVKRTFVDTETGREARVLEKGRVYRVVLEGKLHTPMENFVVCDILPGGMEPLNRKDRVSLSAKKKDAFGVPRETAVSPDQVEVRDDRVLVFTRKNIGSWFKFTYLARAVIPGSYSLPGMRIECMYDPARNYSCCGKGRISIR